tara:strand:+ start:684 stop:875 length:192 start_codon:yes stop_codon:yes gene_type:complete
MKIIILEDAEFEGRNFKKGQTILMGSNEAGRLCGTGKAAPEDTNRSVGLKSSNVEPPEKRGKK